MDPVRAEEEVYWYMDGVGAGGAKAVHRAEPRRGRSAAPPPIDSSARGGDVQCDLLCVIGTSPCCDDAVSMERPAEPALRCTALDECRH